MSVAIAAYNCAPFLRQAVHSALAQTVTDIEVIIVDDQSSDDTLAIARTLAQSDSRVRVFAQTSNGGPAAARNRALAEARGAWFAVLDSDDLYLPDRLAILLAAAERTGADIVADNLVCFSSDDFADVGGFIPADQPARWIDMADYLTGARLFGTPFDLGYLKPMIRLAAIRAAGIAYRPSLRIAEDDELVLRMLDVGLRYWYEPALTYAYRRHVGSISHRLSAANAAESAAAMADLCRTARTTLCKPALEHRRRFYTRQRDFAVMLEAVKARRHAVAARAAFANPAILPMWREAFANRIPWLRNRRETGFVRAMPDNPELADVRTRLLAMTRQPG